MEKTALEEVDVVKQMTDRQKLDMILEAYNVWLTHEGDSSLIWAIEKVIIAEHGVK